MDKTPTANQVWPTVQHPARVAYRVTTLTNAQGQERTVNVRDLSEWRRVITVKDRLGLPRQDALQLSRLFIARLIRHNRDGPDHHEIYFDLLLITLLRSLP